MTATGPGPDQAELARCYRHPDRVAGAVCRRCDRPICPACMHEAPVGWQCDHCIHADSRRAPVTRWSPTRSGAGLLGATGLGPVTGTLIAVNVVVYLFTLSNGALGRFGLEPFEVASGQWYRLLTSAFLHLSVEHLALNMFSLAIVGSPVEQRLGRLRFVALYLLAALGASICSYLVGPYLELSAGASGAIFGLFGAYFVLARRSGNETRTIVMLIAVNLVFSFGVAGIDWRSHVGGLLTGSAVAAGLGWAGTRRSGPAVAGWSVAVLALTLAVLVALEQLPPGHVL